MLFGFLIKPQCAAVHTSPRHRRVVMNSWLCLSNVLIRRSVHGFVLWVSAFSVLHVILREKLAGSRRIHRNTGPWTLREARVLEALLPCVGLVSFASFPGQSSHQDNPVCLSFLPLSTNVNPNGMARRTFWQHQRTEHLQGRALEQEPLTGNLLYAECNNLGGF